ncbi:hypothetical protein BaRGS_00004565 [Batillaria attramentaria]|uniref:Centriolar and ciliogenesis-associated protein HYLS1 C-terminal domain-containing protein n=1 Tax=Batillaria attramentaria TaxID=370345 RepID=A0ABD0LYG7_9CAEN
MDSPLHFSDQEIQEELARLGYTNIPAEKLHEFQKDLNTLIEHERSKENSANTSLSSGHHGSEAVRGTSAAAAQSAKTGETSAAYAYREEAGLQDSCLRREDLEQRDENTNRGPGAQRPKTAPTVPGYYSLFEVCMSSKTKHKGIRDDVSETDSEARRMMKRKTLRKDQKGAKFIDESMTESDAGSTVETHERVQRLLLRDFDPPPSSRPQTAPSARDPPPYRLSPDDHRLPSVIYTSLEHPHTKNLRRADPVARFHQMQHVWAMQQAPGEKLHKGLRWNIKEQMLTQFVPEKKPQRKYVANNYVPPPDKKRKALRWQVRMDMAQGNMPSVVLPREY